MEDHVVIKRLCVHVTHHGAQLQTKERERETDTDRQASHTLWRKNGQQKPKKRQNGRALCLFEKKAERHRAREDVDIAKCDHLIHSVQ